MISVICPQQVIDRFIVLFQSNDETEKLRNANSSLALEKEKLEKELAKVFAYNNAEMKLNRFFADLTLAFLELWI